LLYVGIPMAAALSVTHGFLPPHPGPTAIALMYKADVARTLLYGLIIGIPTIVVAGPLFARTLTRIRPAPANWFHVEPLPEAALPGFGVSLFTALVPVLLMAVAGIMGFVLPQTHPVRPFFDLVGNPVVAMLVAVLVAFFTLGICRGKTMKEINQSVNGSIGSIAMILLIIGGGGAFKQVLIDSGVGQYITGLVSGYQLSPLVLAWSIAALLRVALGSATVAAITTVGIVLPTVTTGQVSPELMVLATGAGSLMFSHVNDSGFWMVKEYFNLTLGQTFASWSVMESIVSVMGLLGVLALNAWVV